MKSRLLIVLMFWMGVEKSGAQNRANDWVLGAWGIVPSPSDLIDFSSGFADTTHILKVLPFFITNASISDTNGNLNFYTNDLFIANRNHDTLYNSIDFNPGYATDFYEGVGMGFTQGAMFLPLPNQPNESILFHLSGEYMIANNLNQALSRDLKYSIIDQNLDQGLGGIIADKKGIVCINDTLYRGKISACKHANGRDWWIVIHEFNSNGYYKLLVTPDSIIGPSKQKIGNIIGIQSSITQSTISPDGSKYVFVEVRDTIEFMQFDRCTGMFSDHQTLVITPSPLLQSLGCSFSPNSRYLYINTYEEIFQFDTWAADINATAIKVAQHDTTDPYVNSFFTEQLAPDGRIYLCTAESVGNFKLYYIDKPDSAGLLSNFNTVGIPLYGPSVSVPNHPNYDLGPLENSGCDTLFNSVVNATTHEFSFSPNPASTYLNIVYSIEKAATVTLTNSYGIAVNQLTLYPYFKNRIVHTDDLPWGVYLITLLDGDTRISRKVVVLR